MVVFPGATVCGYALPPLGIRVSLCLGNPCITTKCLHSLYERTLCKAWRWCNAIWHHSQWWTAKQLAAPDVPVHVFQEGRGLCLNWADLWILENGRSSKSTCPMVGLPWWKMLCSEALLISTANAGVFYSVGAFKILWKLILEFSIFSGEGSFLRQGCFCWHSCQLLFQGNL